MTFDQWFSQLISDEIWYQPASLSHRPETFKAIANRVYMDCVATGFKPIGECRRHVYNILLKTPHDNKKVDWTAKALEKLEKSNGDWQPVPEEERTRRLKEWKTLVDSMPILNNMPRPSHKEEAEDVLPPKPAPYPQTTAQEAYVRQRHLEYIKRNYEPRTGAKLPDWMPEDEFNLQYDNDML